MVHVHSPLHIRLHTNTTCTHKPPTHGN
jgi:hypothetical protein